MVDILVLLPLGVAPPPLREDVEVRTCATAADVVAALAGATGDVVLCDDGLEGSAEDVAAAVAAVDGAVIQVKQGPWDGENHSPVSAACAGVIAGFGRGGVGAAVALLREDA